MLFDPKWGRKTDDRSAESFIAFCDIMGNKRYTYVNERGCAAWAWLGVALRPDQLDKLFGGGSLNVFLARPWTYKAAADRLREQLTQEERGA